MEEEGGARDVQLPERLASLLRARVSGWNSAKALGKIYAPDAILLESQATTGREAVAVRISTLTSRPYTLRPFAFAMADGNAQIAAYVMRGDDPVRSRVGIVMISARHDSSGAWLIASETLRFPAPRPMRSISADDLLKLLDDAEIDRAVVLSMAYIFQSPLLPKKYQSVVRMRGENDWIAAQVAQHPRRLVGFCSVNPLALEAIGEIRRCKTALKLKGLKLHFGNSQVNLRDPRHVAKVQSVFALANQLRMPIVAHVWTLSPDYGKTETDIFIDKLLPKVPDVVVQIAHFAGSGPGWNDDALDGYVRAIVQKDPRAAKLYLDLTTVAEKQTGPALVQLARRIRQVGTERVLYGSDATFGDNVTPDEGWGHFRGMVPLTDEEFAAIRDNVAPYLR